MANVDKYIGLPFIKADVVGKGMRCKFLDGGTEQNSQFGMQLVFKVQNLADKAKYHFSPNGISLDNLKKAFSAESDEWVGKEFGLKLEKREVSGVMKDVIVASA